MNEFKIKNGLTVSGSVEIEQNLTVNGTLIIDELSGDIDYSSIINAPTLVSGSSQIAITGTTGYSTFSSSIATTDLNQNDRLSNIEGVTGSYATTSSVNNISSSINTRIDLITNTQATTGSNNFVGTQTITGSLYVSQDLIVQGSSSLQDITGSNVYIGTNKINLNTDTPAIRFGGVSVFDSGSNFGESGSLLWDSQENHWVYQHPASTGAPYSSAMLISGPKNSGSLGDEQGLTSGKISKAVGDDHIGDSIMTETNGGIGISGSISITGSIVATGTSLWSGSAQLPSGVVSGSQQVDVMSTTNIARLATTGSNSYTSNQIVTGSITSRGLIIDGANNGNVSTLNLTRTDNSWGINNETNLRVYVGSGNTTSPGTRVLEIATTGAAAFSNIITANGEVRSIHGGVDGTFSDAFVGVYSSNNNEQNAIQTSVSSGASLSGFRFQVSNGGGSSGRTTVVDFLRDRQIFYTNVGIGTDSPNVKLEVLDTSTSSGEIARFQRNLDQINEYAYIKVGNASYPAYFGAMLSTYDIAYMSMTPNPTDGKALSIRTTDGFVGIGTVSPSTKLDVVHSSSDRVSARVKNTNGTGSASLILNPEGSGSGSTGDATIFYDCNTTAWVAGIDKSDSSKYKIANDVYGDFRASTYFTIQTNGNVGLSSSSPVAKLDVGGNIKNAGRVYSGNAITGNISPNLDAANTRNYILVCDLNDAAGFSLNGFMNAASYTCWNMSSFYIMKNYSATTAAAGITGQYKGGGCDMNIVDLNYGSGRYIAIGYTSNPEIDVIWTGYRLTHMFASDGSATVVPQSNCTINSTLASY